MTYETVDLYAGKPEHTDDNDWLESQGWESFLTIGDDASVMKVMSYRRTSPEGTTEYVVQVWDVEFGSPFIHADNFGDLMDLFARWAPAIQAATVVHAVDSLREYDLDTMGLVELIAGKAKWGAINVPDDIRRHKRQAAENRRRQPEARKQERQGG